MLESIKQVFSVIENEHHQKTTKYHPSSQVTRLISPPLLRKNRTIISASPHQSTQIRAYSTPVTKLNHSQIKQTTQKINRKISNGVLNFTIKSKRTQGK